MPNSSLTWDGWEEAADITITTEDDEEVPAVLNDLVAFLTATEDVVVPSKYGLLSKDELVRLCRHHGLKVSGNKASLIEWLKARAELGNQGHGEKQDEGQSCG